MWGRRRKSAAPVKPTEEASPLKAAMQQARIEAAERTSVIVDLRDAEKARLELLNEALDPIFAEVPPEVDLFDRGLSGGETPRLWIDAVAHVAMGRDKRSYRFLQDSRVGRHVLAESHELADIVRAVTAYIARRLIERERALANSPDLLAHVAAKEVAHYRRRRRWRTLGALALGFLTGVVTLLALALALAGRG
jgi:hypothetical protein